MQFQYNTQRKFVRGRRQGEEGAILAHQFARELVLDGPGGFANLNIHPFRKVEKAASYPSSRGGEIAIWEHPKDGRGPGTPCVLLCGSAPWGCLPTRRSTSRKR